MRLCRSVIASLSSRWKLPQRNANAKHRYTVVRLTDISDFTSSCRRKNVGCLFFPFSYGMNSLSVDVQFQGLLSGNFLKEKSVLWIQLTCATYPKERWIPLEIEPMSWAHCDTCVFCSHCLQIDSLDTWSGHRDCLHQTQHGGSVSWCYAVKLTWFLVSALCCHSDAASLILSVHWDEAWLSSLWF